MRETNEMPQDTTDTIDTPLKGLMFMAGSVLAIIVAVGLPVLGESILAALLYGKSAKKVFGMKGDQIEAV